MWHRLSVSRSRPARHHWMQLCIGLLYLGFGAAMLQAQKPVPLSSPFLVNTATQGNQFSARIATRSNGDFVVVWEHHDNSGVDGDPADQQSVQAQRYASDGTPQGAQFQINAYTTNTQRQPDVVYQSSGEFVVVWTSLGAPSQGPYLNIQGRRFASDGTPLGNQFPISPPTSFHRTRPRIAVDGMDRFVVVWDGESDSLGFTIQGQRFDAAAQPLGDALDISTFNQDGGNIRPHVNMAADGRFVVAWEGRFFSGDDPSERSVQARRFDSLGIPHGPQFLVNSYTTGNQQDPSVDLQDNGSFIVVWESERSTNGDEDPGSIQGRLYHSDGTPAGESFRVNYGPLGSQSRPSAQFGTDDFVVVWSERSGTGSFATIEGRRFNTSGEPFRGDFTISRGEMAYPVRSPHLAFDASGHFVVVWHSSPIFQADDWGYSVLARRYCNPQPCVFADDFESGDTSAWIYTEN